MAPIPRRPDRRSEILVTAARLFAEQGFHATSMRDLCAALSMSPGNLYHWFPSKQAIIAAFVEADRATTASRLAALSTAGDLASAAVPQIIGYVTTATDAEIRLFLEIYAAALRDPELAPLVRTADAEARAGLAALLRGAGIADPEATAVVVIALVDGLVSRRAIEPGCDLAALAGPVGAALGALLARRVAP
jgi:AcrR family transcriptional regulator